MAEILWSIEEAGKNHDVRLRHKYWTGKRQLWLDGELIHTSRKLNSQGFVHRFSLGEKQVEVMITTNGFTYTYFLLVDHRPVPSEAQKTQGITTATLLAHRNLRDLAYWLDLADLTGLTYRPQGDEIWLRHRLDGKLNEFPVSARAGRYRKPAGNAILWDFLTARLANDEEVSSMIRQDPDVHQRFSVAGKQTELAMAGDISKFGIPFHPKKFPAEDMIDLVTFVLSKIGLHGGKPAGQSCQSCGKAQALHYTYVSDQFALLCDGCLRQIQHKEDEVQRVMKQAEAEWPKVSLKTIAILAVMTFGSAWGISLVSADFWLEISGILGYLPMMFFVVILLYFPKQLKSINLSALLASIGLTSLAMVTGIFALGLGLTWSQRGIDLSWEMIIDVFQGMVDTDLWIRWVGIGLLFTGPLLIYYYVARQKQIKRLSHPNIEIIDL